MAQNIIDQLRERGLVKQVVFEEDLKKLLEEGSQSFYIGFDHSIFCFFSASSRCFIA